MEGWILLHRKLQDCEIWANSQPFDMRSAWVDLLLLANHRDVEIVFDYTPMTVKRGQYLTSVRKLCARWSWSKDRTLKYLRLLESLKMIRRESNKQRTLITIENYSVYQDMQDTGKDTGSYTGTDTEQTRNGHKTDTGKDTGSPQTNNVKNVKNEKNEKNEKEVKYIKHIYGEYGHIKLTDAERERLFNDFGEEEALEAIKYLDEYKERKGYKSKNDNLTLRKWVFDAVKRDKGGSGSGIDFGSKDKTQTAQSLAQKWGLEE